MPDNPNKPGVGPNKGDLGPGDIEWVVEPTFEPAQQRELSRDQKADLATRIRRKLRLAASESKAARKKGRGK